MEIALATVWPHLEVGNCGQPNASQHSQSRLPAAFKI